MEVLPGIHRVPGLRLANSYLLVEDRQLTLIDAGIAGSGGKILAYLRRLGRCPDELTRVLLTHSHPDHSGPLPGLNRRTGADVVIHPAETHPEDNLRLRFSFRAPLWPKVFADRLIDDREVLPVMGGLRVLHTPGHTPGSVCFLLEDAGVLFTGDTLFSDGRIFRRPFFLPHSSFKDYRESIERLAETEFETALSGHDVPMLQGGRREVKAMLDDYSWWGPRWRSIKRRLRQRLSSSRETPAL